MGLAKKTVEGTIWASLTFGLGKMLLFASSIILARLLTPADFGLAGLALVVIDFLGIIKDIGVSHALIYKNEQPDRVASTAFWISGLAGFSLFSVAVLVSPAAALFFDEPRVEPLVQLLAVSFLITSIGSTHDALLQKELNFKKKLFPDLSQALFRGGFSILLAWLGWGVWSLIWGQVVGALAFTIAAWLILPWRPSLTFNLKTTKMLTGYGYQIIITDLLGTIGSRTDFLFIGKLMGEVALGFYNVAFKIPDLAIMSIMAVTSRVIFPAYAKLQHDPPAMRRAFLVTLQFIALIAFPLGTGLYMVAPDLVVVLYTDKWAPAIPALQVLTLFATIRIIGWAGTGSIYKAIGRPDIITKTSLLRTILLVPASWWAISQYGIVGAALAQLSVTALTSMVNLFIAHRMLQIKLSTILAEMRLAFFASVVMLICVEIFLYLASPLPGLARLVTASTLGALVYVLTIWMLSRETVLLARKLIGFAPTVSKG
jgi:PST family polysaccharide transporter